MKHVVLWDPKGEYWEGAIVDGEQVGRLEDRGVVVLPCSPELFSTAAFAGFAKRSWGSGWPLDGAVPVAVCPLAIYYPGEPYRALRWKARLVGKSGQGIPLRIAAGEGRGNVVRPVLQDIGKNCVEIGSLGKPDSNGGWTVGGESLFCASGPGFFSLALYGCAMGMRVAWVAATLTPIGAGVSLSASSLVSGKI